MANRKKLSGAALINHTLKEIGGDKGMVGGIQLLIDNAKKIEFLKGYAFHAISMLPLLGRIIGRSGKRR